MTPINNNQMSEELRKEFEQIKADISVFIHFSEKDLRDGNLGNFREGATMLLMKLQTYLSTLEDSRKPFIERIV